MELRWNNDRGLSPRVRGNQNINKGNKGHFGSIPACAGEPPPRTPLYQLCRVYPRVCGGTLNCLTPTES